MVRRLSTGHECGLIRLDSFQATAGAGMAAPRPIQSFAMKMPRWDRIYFFAFSATTFAVLGYVVLLVVPLIEITSSDTQEVTRRTLLADGQG